MADTHQNPETRDLRERSFPELFGDLSGEISRLVSDEVELAKAELGEKIIAAGQGVGLLSASMVALLMTAGSATALVIIAISNFLASWVAALIVTGLWLLSAVLFIVSGSMRIKKTMPPVPEKTVQTFKEDVKWFKGQKR